MSPPKHIIYGLIDPRTMLIRYVGKSSSGMRRPHDHRRTWGRAKNTHSARWVAELQRDGFDFGIVVLDASAPDRLAEHERWWIAYGRALGWPLTNLTDGGERRARSVSYTHLTL